LNIKCIIDGSVYCWGYGRAGSLGLQSLRDEFVPRRVLLSNDNGIKKILFFTNLIIIFFRLFLDTSKKIKLLGASLSHTLVADDQGKLYYWGGGGKKIIFFTYKTTFVSKHTHIYIHRHG